MSADEKATIKLDEGLEVESGSFASKRPDLFFVPNPGYVPQRLYPKWSCLLACVNACEWVGTTITCLSWLLQSPDALEDLSRLLLVSILSRLSGNCTRCQGGRTSWFSETSTRRTRWLYDLEWSIVGQQICHISSVITARAFICPSLTCLHSSKHGLPKTMPLSSPPFERGQYALLLCILKASMPS